MRWLLAALFIAVSPAPSARDTVSGSAGDITIAQIGEEILPPVFVETLLELPDDAAQAAKSGKRLLLYFGQAGCPYCKELMQTSFTQEAIVDKTAKPGASNSGSVTRRAWCSSTIEARRYFASKPTCAPSTSRHPSSTSPAAPIARSRSSSASCRTRPST